MKDYIIQNSDGIAVQVVPGRPASLLDVIDAELERLNEMIRQKPHYAYGEGVTAEDKSRAHDQRQHIQAALIRALIAGLREDLA